MTDLAHITYADACTDAHLFGPWFRGESWATWRVIDKAIFGEPLDADELAIFRELTGRDEAPTEPVREAWLAFGRKAGKDLFPGFGKTGLCTRRSSTELRLAFAGNPSVQAKSTLFGRRGALVSPEV